MAELTASGCPKGEGQGWPESQASLQIDAAATEKGRFRMKINFLVEKAHASESYRFS
jgi:hypothetical protein